MCKNANQAIKSSQQLLLQTAGWWVPTWRLHPQSLGWNVTPKQRPTHSLTPHLMQVFCHLFQRRSRSILRPLQLQASGSSCAFADFPTVGLQPSSLPHTNCVHLSPDSLPTIPYEFKPTPCPVHLRKNNKNQYRWTITKIWQLSALYGPLKTNKNIFLYTILHRLIKDKDISLFIMYSVLGLNNLM